MMHRVERLAARLTETLSSWPGVESVVSCEASETDVIDPYFALVLDVYCDGPIPGGDERQATFEDPGAFETSRGGEKDRFFIDGLPIRLEYKQTRMLEEFVSKSFDAMWVFASSGTYMLHRLVNGTALFTRSDWLDRMRKSLAESPDDFWDRLAEANLQKMEHCLSDLGGAALKDDRYFYFVSLAGFMRACVSVLFAKNKEWEPSERHMAGAIASLKSLPDDFLGRWATLMRTDGQIEPAKRYQVAQLIARSVLALG